MASETKHDHQDCIDKALSSAEKLCDQRGVRFTRIRRRVLELIWSNHEAAKAYDLLEHLKSFEPAAKPATVYRALDFLLELGLIHRVESLNAFVGCNDAENQHELLLLICDKCNTVEERRAAELMQVATREIEAARFVAHRKAFEVHGLCARCAAN
jgi:Fur family zinc uptake transcriptional regulator